MKVTFLGTGTSQGVPVIACECAVCRSLDFRDKRLRTSIHIAIDHQSFVIDTGPDFRQQMLRERISHLDAVLFTHQHKDHTAGLDDIRSYNFKQNQDMPIYARPEVLAQIQKEFSYIFASVKYPGIPSVELYPVDNQPFEIKGIRIIPINVFHHKLPVFGFRFEDFAYVTDVNFIEEIELEKLKNLKVLVLGALQKEPHISHFSLSEALNVIERLAPKKAYLTHISHRMGLHREVLEELPENVELAYDGLRLYL